MVTILTLLKRPGAEELLALFERVAGRQVTEAEKQRGREDHLAVAVVVLMLLPWSAQAQPLPPDQACAAIVRTLDDATGNRDSNREAVRRGLIACRLFATGTPSPAAPADPLADIEPNPRGITRAEVEAAIADWCSTHMQAPLCQKLLRR
jgi:hypothetical protein